MTYKMTICASCEKDVYVEADSKDEAWKSIVKQWHNDDIDFSEDISTLKLIDWSEAKGLGKSEDED